MADAVPDSRLVGDRSLRVGVIGAGMAGILAVIKLREAGITDIVCFEKADRVGGTWRENTYPGIGCDVPSHVYSYSFAPNPDFTRMFSPGHEIQAYLERCGRPWGRPASSPRRRSRLRDLRPGCVAPRDCADIEQTSTW